MQNKLYDNDTRFFYDIWAMKDPSLQRMAFEGMWPMVVGAATNEQANRVIDENLLNPDRFFSQHGICTVGLKDPLFELRMWRGPCWNSMSYWAARGCLLYGRNGAANKILTSALDDSAKQFKRTGTIWEFYHPHGEKPEDINRKPYAEYNTPCRDYVGHNPLFAMARMYDKTK